MKFVLITKLPKPSEELVFFTSGGEDYNISRILLDKIKKFSGYKTDYLAILSITTKTPVTILKKTEWVPF